MTTTLLPNSVHGSWSVPLPVFSLRQTGVRGVAAGIALAAVLAAAGRADEVDWHALAGGGGASVGGNFSLAGTVAQTGAGTLAGKPYLVVGGFWGISQAIQTPGGPLLSIILDVPTDAVRVSWPVPGSGWLLEKTSTLAGSPPRWSQVVPPYQTNSTHVFATLPREMGNTFFRLRQAP